MKELRTAAALAGIVIAMPAAAQETLREGGFVAGDVGYDGEGTAAIVPFGDNYIVELRDFATSPGPDLYVVLVEAENAVTSDAIKNSSYVNLGDLQGTSGDQSYPVPPDVDIASYNTVAIWCEAYAVLFTAAPLE